MPTVIKETIIPADPNDLICDTCPERYPFRGDMMRTFESARVRGWHIYAEMSAKGSRDSSQSPYTLDRIAYDVKALCPQCVGTARSRLPAPPVVLEGQADILEDLAIEVTPAEKEKKPPKRGIN